MIEAVSQRVHMSERRAQLKEKAIIEARKFAIIVAYLWALFVVFELHKFVVLRSQDRAMPLTFKVGFALINALILGKVVLIGEAFHVGERYMSRPLAYAVVFKSAMFAILLVAFDIAEEVIVGLFHHRTIAQSMPPLGGGGLVGMFLVALIAFIVLIPFFTLDELVRDMGQSDLFSIIFRPRKLNSAKYER